MRRGSLVFLLCAAAGLAVAEALSVEHQQVPCTIPDKAIAICAGITGDNPVAKTRIYFREAGEKFYNFVDMAFGGINYCGTLPAPKDGKVKAIEYYIQATDDQYESQRTPTFQMQVQAEGVCEFPPVEKDMQRAASIVVYATHKKQGKKLSEAFLPTGVSFVAIPGN